MHTQSSHRDPILDALRTVSRQNPGTLCLFVPAHTSMNDGIPYIHGRGCNTLCSEWESFTDYVRGVATDPELDAKFKELAEEACYGGTGGIILTLTRTTLDLWEKTGSLAVACREDYLAGKQEPRWLRNRVTGQPRLWVAVLDFLNGSGDTIEVDCDWRKFQLPQTGEEMSIVNNSLHDIFWFADLGKIHTVGETCPGLRIRD